jgi:hypothetical protein
MWVIDLLVILLSPHPEALARPSTPKVLQAKEPDPTLYHFDVFTFRLAIESTKEFGGKVNYSHGPAQTKQRVD